MRRVQWAVWLVLLMGIVVAAEAQNATKKPSHANEGGPYLGFDRNDYPGDATLPTLRRTFRFTSYWLNNPPGETANRWAGKRAILSENGFGFLVLFTGRTDAEIKAARSAGKSAERLGAEDGKNAVAAAAREGFPKDVVIFLDQEEGGRLLPEQAAYLFAWADAVQAAGARGGVYCSEIDVPEGSGTINTARDIVERESARSEWKGSPKSSRRNAAEPRIVLWVANDACPPAPACILTAPPLRQGVPENLRGWVTVWQYAQSPRRAQFSANCPANQAADGNCYAPGFETGARVFVDLDVADSPDPSETNR